MTKRGQQWRTIRSNPMLEHREATHYPEIGSAGSLDCCREEERHCSMQRKVPQACSGNGEPWACGRARACAAWGSSGAGSPWAGPGARPGPALECASVLRDR